ncbi:MAG: hypothetical protein PHO79_07715 [Desulfoplanes sp.]|nr:hypothetical protein [Bacteroidales bacterium]MDD4649882.1 hypothetical protein [Desulfoplanes sp.]
MCKKESALPGAKTDDEHGIKDEQNSAYKQINSNVARTLQSAAEACQRSSIGAIFEHKNLKLTNSPDPLSGLRKLAANREWRLEKCGNKMSDKQREILLDELSDIQEAINVLDEQKYEVWGLVYSYLKQLPNGLSAAIITLPLSMSGQGIATIDLMTRKALICVYPEEAN